MTLQITASLSLTLEQLTVSCCLHWLNDWSSCWAERGGRAAVRKKTFSGYLECSHIIPLQRTGLRCMIRAGKQMVRMEWRCTEWSSQLQAGECCLSSQLAGNMQSGLQSPSWWCDCCGWSAVGLGWWAAGVNSGVVLGTSGVQGQVMSWWCLLPRLHAGGAVVTQHSWIPCRPLAPSCWL